MNWFNDRVVAVVAVVHIISYFSYIIFICISFIYTILFLYYFLLMSKGCGF